MRCDLLPNILTPRFPSAKLLNVLLGCAAGQEDVRLAAVAVLKNMVHECLGGEVGGEHEGVFASLEAGLGPTQQEIWISVLSGEGTGP